VAAIKNTCVKKRWKSNKEQSKRLLQFGRIVAAPGEKVYASVQRGVRRLCVTIHLNFVNSLQSETVQSLTDLPALG